MDTPQKMTYEEREQLKRFADDIGGDAAPMLVCIAHWMREPKPVSFTKYLAKWIKEDNGFDLGGMIRTWEDA